MKGSDGNTYIVLDKWMSEEDYEDFLAANRESYQSLETETRDLYDEELSLGNYTIMQ